MKEWTIFVYANGNNELEPEVWKGILDLQAVNDREQFNIVIQVAREDPKITQLIRRYEKYHTGSQQWVGARRYIITHQSLELIEQLPEGINMADPDTLGAFLAWGYTHYPAHRVMVVVGGHVYQFVGISPDFTLDKPYLLGFSEMADAIQNVCEALKFEIDILVLDTCYASTFEVLYEFGKYQLSKVKHILTYIGEGPLEGLPYPILLKKMDEYMDKCTSALLERIIQDMKRCPTFNAPLVAIKVEEIVLKLCKQKFSQIGYKYLTQKEHLDKAYTPYDIFFDKNPNLPWHLEVQYIQVAMKLLILAKTEEKTDLEPISVLYKVIPDAQRQAIYKRLSFAKDNYWTYVLCQLELSQKLDIPPDNKLVVLSRYALHSFIVNMNRNLSVKGQEQIVEELSADKQWELE